MSVDMGFNYGEFVDYTPVSQASPSDACICSSATDDKFRFSKEPMKPLQLHFAKKFAALARMHGTRLILLTLPRTWDKGAPFVQEREYWPEIMDSDVTMVGFPPSKLFSGMAPGDIEKLYYNEVHLNENGQKFFTKLITPTLLKLYEAQATH